MRPAAVAALAAAALLTALATLHQVDEGHVGVYWRGGALLDSTSGPGWHVRLPFVTTFAQVQVTVQTDRVRDIPCGTAGGVMIHFDAIEVVNRLRPEAVVQTVRQFSVDYDRILIFDKIHHEINQWCSAHTLQEVYVDLFDRMDDHLSAALQRDCDKWAPGLEIISARVTKPVLPQKIRDNYENMEVEKTNLLISRERQRVLQKEAETASKVAVIAAERDAAVARIMSSVSVLEKEGEQRVEAIANNMTLARKRALADAELFTAQREAEANRLRLTPELLQLELWTQLRAQRKTFFGESVAEALRSPFVNVTALLGSAL